MADVKDQDWFEETDEGANITLLKPLDIDGAKVNVISMREPTVNDQLTGQKVKGDDGEKEIALFANLCQLSPDQIKSLKLRDYKRVQDAYVSFTN